LPHQDRLNIAVFIDFDNIEIGVKTTLGQQFDVGVILDAIKERGEVVTKIAYADWTRSGEYSRSLTQHAIRLVQRNMTPGGDKNGADINLALDALEMAFTHPHINAYVIVGGDSDFLSLVEKLKQYDKKVFVVGGRAFTSVILQRNCHEFIAYENLHGVRKAAIKTGRPMPAAAASSPVAQAFPVVKRALKILADREVTPQTGLLKSTLLQLDSTFSERNYGASSFLDFVEKLANTGFVHLKTSGRSVMVELNPTFDEGDRSRAASAETEPADAAGISASSSIESVGPAAASSNGDAAPVAGQIVRPASDRPVSDQQPSGAGQAFRPASDHHRSQEPVGPPAGDQADGVRLVGSVLAAATTARWPMYLRNVKQILRAADSTFDERRYGFSGLMELLRACQKENLIRLERDRRGGLRVFQGSALQLQRTSTEPAQGAQAFETQPVDVSTAQAFVAQDAADADMVDSEPMPTVDPTAELLGRAKARRPRSRLAATPVAGPEPTPTRARKTSTRSTGSRAKPTTTRTRSGGRGKKSSAADTNDDFGNR
jgi:uncharacterized LabA/DUF88 family protein